jgi:cell division cycle 14
MKSPATLLPGRLAFLSASNATLKAISQSNEGKTIRFVSSDLHNRYQPLADDFGPVNLGIVHRFCTAFSKKIAQDDSRLLVYCFDETFEAQANSSFLLGSLLMVHFGWTPDEAAEPFVGASSPFKLRPFRDATFSPRPYPLRLPECLKGLAKSIALGWFDCKTFDAKQYEELDNPYNGDVHQICPKFIAFKGPLAVDSHHREPNEVAFPPDHYAPLLRSLGASSVVRLNDADTYLGEGIEQAGLAHHDLFFTDCTIPSDAVVARFLGLCDAAPGAVAVHCRAGLGRTGTLIGVWLMKHAGFGADEAMGWLRIVRPGSVIGPQQAFLRACEGRPWRGNTLLPPATPLLPPLGRRDSSSAPGNLRPRARICFPAAASSSLEEDGSSAAELARQVMAGMVARGAARIAPAAARKAAGAFASEGAGLVGGVRAVRRNGGCGAEHRAEAAAETRRRSSRPAAAASAVSS